jgi:hypothetical protein
LRFESADGAMAVGGAGRFCGRGDWSGAREDGVGAGDGVVKG